MHLSNDRDLFFNRLFPASFRLAPVIFLIVAAACSNGKTPPQLPAAPTNVMATAGVRSAQVSWTAPSNAAASAISGYTVAATPGPATASADGSATSVTVNGLADGTNYTFQVTARGAGGTSPASTPSAAITTFAAPDAPTGVQVSTSPGIATVTWIAPAVNGGTPVTGYLVTASPGGASVTAAATATSASLSGLTLGTSYTFTVHAINAVGAGPESAPSSAVVLSTAPAAPGNVVAVPGITSATVSFSAPANTGGLSLLGYDITAWSAGTAAGSITVVPPATGTVFTGLTADTAYTFSVVARNATGASPAASSSAVTPSGPPISGSSTFTISPSSVVADGTAAASLSVVLLDQAGVPVVGQSISFACGNASIGVSRLPATGTDGNGRAVGTWSSTHAGAQSCSLLVNGSTFLSAPVTFVAGPPDAAHTLFTATPSSVPADGSMTSSLQITVRDTYDNVIGTGVPVSLAASGSNNAFDHTSAVSDGSGLVHAKLWSTTAETKTVTVTLPTGTATLPVTFTATPWQRLATPFSGGAVADVAVGPATGNVYLATSRHLEISQDNGLTFTPVTATENGNIMSVASGEDSGADVVYVSGIRGGVLYFGVSRDAGATWQLEHPSFNAGEKLYVAPTAAGTVASLGYNAVSISTDFGATWRATLPPIAANVLTFSGTSASTVYVTGGTGSVARSTDGGATWTTTSTAALCSGSSVALATDPRTTPETLYLLCDNTDGLFASHDQGVSWTSLGKTGMNSASLAVDLHQSGVFYAGTSTGQVLRSSDGGASWTSLFGNGQNSASANRIVMNASSQAIYAGFGASGAGSGSPGLVRSTDGGLTFAASNASRKDFDAHVLVRDPKSGTLLAMVDTLAKSTDDGATWSPLPTAGLPDRIPYTAAIDPNNGNIYLGYSFAGMYKLSSGGTAWTRMTTPFWGVWRISVIPEATPSLYVLSATSVVYRSTDGGATWSTGATISSMLAWANLGGGVLLVGGYDSTTSKWAIFRSADGGATFASVHAFATGDSPDAFAVDPATPGIVYVAGYVSLLKSTDGGLTYSQLTSPLPAMQSIAVSPADSRQIYVGSQGKVARSTDGGATWSDASIGLGNSTAMTLVPTSTAGRVLAGTDNSGIYVTASGGQ